MRARLDSMAAREHYSFLCVPKMAEEIIPIIADNGGEIISTDTRSYGIVMSVQKKA